MGNLCIATVRAGLFCATASAAIMLSGVAAAQTLPASSAPPQVNTDSSSEIVVTAQRKEERAQNVPISITAFSPDRLQQQGITQAQDLQGAVPSLTVGTSGQGSREAQSFTIRGQGATLQASPGVVVYLNEVPLPSPISLNQQGGPGNFVDLQNMQILNGPQGTLFGRNTTGGAVLLVPQKPTADFGGYGQVKFGSYDNREFEGAINLPLVPEKVLLRVTGAFQDRDGFTKDIVWNNRRDDLHWWSGRIGLILRPTETFENYTVAYSAYSSNNGTGQINRGFNVDALAAYGFCYEGPTIPGTIASCEVYRAAAAEAQQRGPRQAAYSTDTYQKTKTWGISNTSALDLTHNLKLRNIVSYQRFQTRFAVDNDGSLFQQDEYDARRFPAPGQASLLGEGLPLAYLPPAPTIPRDRFRTVTEELQLQGNLLEDRLSFTVGGFLFDQRPTGSQGASVYGFCPAVFTGFCDSQRLAYAITTKSKALYGQATLDVGAFASSLDGLKLTGGYRYTWDTISGTAAYYTPLTAFPGTFACSDGTVVTNAVQCQFRAKLKTRAPTWTGGFDYRVSPDLLLYAKVSRGYKAGGINTNAVFVNTRTFQPETVTSYESGFKSDFDVAGLKSLLNISYYYLDYKNIQRAAPDVNGALLGAQILGATARVQGVEVEASIRPAQGLALGGNFSYTDAKYKRYEYTTNLGAVDCNKNFIEPGSNVDLSCVSFSGVAPYTYSFHISAEQPLADHLGELVMFLSYSHTSSQHTAATALPGTEPGEKLEGFGTLSLSLDWRNVARSNLDLGFYATNLTNNLYRIGNSNLFNTYLYQSSVYGEPRMYGIRARYTF